MPSLEDKLSRNLDRLVSLAPGGSGEPAPGPEDFKKEIQDLGGSSMIEDESVEDSEPEVANLDDDAGETTSEAKRRNDTDTPISAGLPHPMGGAKTR